MSHPLTREQQLELYYFLRLNRQLEERLARIFRQNKLVGGLYSSLGEEAVSVGTAFALEPHDRVAPMIRNTGALLVKGSSRATSSLSIWLVIPRRPTERTPRAISES